MIRPFRDEWNATVITALLQDPCTIIRSSEFQAHGA